jgi:hypothetical protein
MSEIGAAQDRDINLHRQLAARHFYRIGKRLHFGGTSLAVALALASPLVLLYRPSLGPTLGAIAGVWIFVSRLVLEPFKQRSQLKGAKAQELFDCAVLGLNWNESLAKPLAAEEIRKASRSKDGVDKVKSWYPTSNEMQWPRSVLTCQRSNAVWARRQHEAYGLLLWVLAAGWFVVGVVVAVAHGASLGEYLVTIALPSLPALLDASDMSRGHTRAAASRQLLEDQTDSLLGGAVTDLDLREVQDQLFSLRNDPPLIPEWFYKLVKPSYESDMQYAAKLAAQAEPEQDSAEPREES